MKPDPCVEVCIGEVKVKALVDTGAQITAITLGLYKVLEEKNIPIQPYP